MNLERHLRVLWRYKLIVGMGFLLAIALAFLASYQLGGGGLKRRGTETWSSTSQVLVTQKGFPWGRVTLPDASIQKSGTSDPSSTTTDGSSPDHVQYADPSRFVNLALLYSVISYSDQVRGKLSDHPRADQIQATLLDPTNSGQSYLPVISLTTTAATASGAVKLNQDVFKGLREELVSQQQEADITDPNRVLLTILSKPSQPTLVQGFSMTSSMLAFILCIVAAVALAHILEGLRLARARRAEMPMPMMPPVQHEAPVMPESNGHHAPNPGLVSSGAGLSAPAPPPPPPSTWRS